MNLTAKNVRYRYRDDQSPALDGVNLEVGSGEYFCISGPNGSGKTTLLRLAAGLLPMEGFTGELEWNGRGIEKWNRLELARHIAFVPGNLAPRFAFAVEDFILQGRFAHSSLYTRPSSRDRDIARAAMEKTGIASIAMRAITELSAGQLQLVLLARALTQEPQALILDEATAHLDLSFQAGIFDLLATLHAKGVTILLVSHDLNLAAEFCPRLAWIDKGRIVRHGSMTETLTTETVASIYGAHNRLAVDKNPFSGKPKLFWK